MRSGKHLSISQTIPVLSLVLMVVLIPGPCRGEATILRLTYRNASEVLPMVENLLSREGRAAADPQSNSLVLVDTPESIRRIQDFLASLDQPVKQARIRVRFVESGASQKSSLSAEGAVSGRNWTASKGRSGDAFEIRGGDSASGHREKSEYYVQASSGSWAYIAVGKDIPLTVRWIDLARRHGRILESAAVRRIESGFEVRPVIMGDRAEVEIVPRISHEAPGARRQVIRFADVSTRTTVPLGQWTEIGAADMERNEVLSGILETGSGGRESSLSISLMVESVD